MSSPAVQKKVILIGGTARCGSTLADLILGHDPRGFSLGEVVRHFRPTRTHHFDIKCACGIYPCPTWERLGGESWKNLYDAIFRRLDVDFVVDSSKSLAWIVDQNRQLASQPGVEVLNVFLYKDPVALFYSHWKRGDRDPGKHAGRYAYYQRAMQARIPFVTMNFDWFVREIETSLPRLCGLLGLPYFEQKSQFWRQRERHHLWGSFGPRRQLFERDPSIYIEEMHPDFLELAGGFEARFAADPQIQSVLRRLEGRDIRSLEHFPAAASTVRRGRSYWEERLRELIARFRPEPYLDREASLIREWRV